MNQQELEQLIEACARMIQESQRTHITPEHLKREMNVTISCALQVMDKLRETGVVGPRVGNLGHPVICRVPRAQSRTDQDPRVTALPSEPDAVEAAEVLEAATDLEDRVEQPPISMLSLAEVQLEPEVQVRTRVDPVKVDEYAKLMESEDRFPPVFVFRVGGSYLLADGFHRVAAARRINRLEIAAHVHDGSVREAVLHALRANTTHGLPLTREEKRHAALRLLQDPEWKDWSDREIARHCGVSGMTIARLRSRENYHKVKVTTRKCRDRNGHVRTMNVERVGRKRQQSSSDWDPSTAAESLPEDALSERGKEAVRMLLRQVEQLLVAPNAIAVFAESNPQGAEILRTNLASLLDLLDRVRGAASREGRRIARPSGGSRSNRKRTPAKSRRDA